MILKRIKGLAILTALATITILSIPTQAFAAALTVTGQSNVSNASKSDDGSLYTYAILSAAGTGDVIYSLQDTSKVTIYASSPNGASDLSVEWLNSSNGSVGSSQSLSLTSTKNSWSLTPPTGAQSVVLMNTSGSEQYIYEVYQDDSDGSSTNSSTSTTPAVDAAGTLTITPPSVSVPFPSVKLNGRVQSISATLSNWQVTDASGTGNGWKVQVQASPFTEVAPSGGFSSGATPLTLPQGSLSLNGNRSLTATAGSQALNGSYGPYFVNTGAVIDVGKPVNILAADVGYGMGTYVVHEPTNGLVLSLNPSTTMIDNTNYPSQPTPYESTLTYTISSGP